MGQQSVRQDIIEFLISVAKPGSDFDQLDDDVNLIDAGIIDSLALIQIIAHIEQSHGLTVEAGRVDPDDLGSIGGILSVIGHDNH